MLLPQVENSSCVIGEQLFSNEMLMLFLVQVLNINDFIFTQLHKNLFEFSEISKGEK